MDLSVRISLYKLADRNQVILVSWYESFETNQYEYELVKMNQFM